MEVKAATEVGQCFFGTLLKGINIWRWELVLLLLFLFKALQLSLKELSLFNFSEE